MIETIRQVLTKRLLEHGLLEQQVKAVMQALIEEPAQESMGGRWDDPANDYPAGLVNTIWVCCKDAAVRWIDQHEPKHWARAMFVSG